MNIDMYADVLEFMARFQPEQVGQKPGLPKPSTVDLRGDLMDEELDETLQAMCRDDLPAIADGLADLIYVALGTAIAYGIDLRPVWSAVHAANMAKIGGPTREDGKVLKPEGWQPPDIKGILERQGTEGGAR